MVFPGVVWVFHRAIGISGNSGIIFRAYLIAAGAIRLSGLFFRRPEEPNSKLVTQARHAEPTKVPREPHVVHPLTHQRRELQKASCSPIRESSALGSWHVCIGCLFCGIPQEGVKQRVVCHAHRADRHERGLRARLDVLYQGLG